MASVRPYRFQARHWEATISLGRDPQRPGRYLRRTVILCPASCKRGCSEFPQYRVATKAQAARAADRIAEELKASAQARQRQASSPSFRQLVDDWMIWLRDEGKSRNTLHSYRGLADKHLLPKLGDRPAIDITTPELQRHIDAIRASGLSPASCERILSVARQAYRWGVQRGYVVHNPAREVRRPSKPKTQVEMPSPELVRRTLEILRSEQRWLEVFTILAAATGARRGELCALRWADVEGGQLTIAASVNQWREVGPTKTHARRTIYLGGLALAALTSWHDEQLNEMRSVEGLDAKQLPGQWFIFPSDDGPLMPRNPDAVTRAVARLRAKHGLPRVWLHGLRHHAASTMLRGGDPVQTAKILGQSSTKLTLDVYAHTLGTSQEAIERLDRALRPSGDTGAQELE